DHLAEERPLHALHLADPAAGVAALRVGARRGAAPAALLADHRGVHGDVPGHPERRLGQLQVQPDQRVRAGPRPGPGPAAARAAPPPGPPHQKRRPRCPPPPPTPPNGLPPPSAAAAYGSPPRSTMRRLSGSASTS